MSIFKTGKLAAPEMSGPVLWALHLSDVHFRDPKFELSRDKAVGRFTGALKKFMKSWRAAFPKEHGLDTLFITGDLTYQCAYEDLQEVPGLLTDVLETAGVPGSRVYIVPGEHDVYLKYQEDKDDELRFPDPESWNRFLESERKGRSLKIEARLTNYRTLLHDLASKHGSRIPCGSADFYYADAFDHRGQSVAVLGLNTAWACTCRLDEDQGQLYLGDFQAQDAHRIARRINHDREPDLVIGLLHHPLEWISAQDASAVSELARATDLFFRGHAHAGEVWADPQRQKAPVLSTSSWAAADLVPGFLVAAVAIAERRVYVWPYLWDPEEQAFQPRLDPSPDRAGSPYYAFDLGPA